MLKSAPKAFIFFPQGKTAHDELNEGFVLMSLLKFFNFCPTLRQVIEMARAIEIIYFLMKCEFVMNF